MMIMMTIENDDDDDNDDDDNDDNNNNNNDDDDDNLLLGSFDGPPSNWCIESEQDISFARNLSNSIILSWWFCKDDDDDDDDDDTKTSNIWLSLRINGTSPTNKSDSDRPFLFRILSNTFIIIDAMVSILNLIP